MHIVLNLIMHADAAP